MNRIPLKMLVLPDVKWKSGKGFFKRSCARIKGLLWDKTRVYFVCGLSYRPGESGQDKRGYQLSFDTKLLRGLRPLLALSAIILKAAMGAYGLPLPLPEGVTRMMYADAVSEFVCDQLQSAVEDGLDGLGSAAESPGGEALCRGAMIEGSLQQVYEMLLR